MWAEQSPEHGASGEPFSEGVSSVLGVLPPEKERNTRCEHVVWIGRTHSTNLSKSFSAFKTFLFSLAISFPPLSHLEHKAANIPPLSHSHILALGAKDLSSCV